VLVHIREASITNHIIHLGIFFCGAATQRGSRLPHFLRFLDHSQRRTTVGRTPLDEWLARRRDLYLTTHTTHTRERHPWPRWDSSSQFQQASGRRPTTYTARGHWDRQTMGIGNFKLLSSQVRKTGKIGLYQFLIYIHPFPPLSHRSFICPSSNQ
jgi:hypothetical protein